MIPTAAGQRGRLSPRNARVAGSSGRPNSEPCSSVCSPNGSLSTGATSRAYLDVEVPSGNGVGTARSIARAYSVFAAGGVELGITPETFARITAPPVVARPNEVIGIPSYFSLGFLRPGPEMASGSSQRAFGSPGPGGSFGFADPGVHLGYA